MELIVWPDLGSFGIARVRRRHTNAPPEGEALCWKQQRLRDVLQVVVLRGDAAYQLDPRLAIEQHLAG